MTSPKLFDPEVEPQDPDELYYDWRNHAKVCECQFCSDLKRPQETEKPGEVPFEGGD